MISRAAPGHMPEYHDFNNAVVAGEVDILQDIFAGPQLNPLFRRGKGQLEKCYSDEENGRLIWIYRLPADDEIVVAPFLDNPCKNFIIDLSFSDEETHAPHTEKLVRDSSTTSLVPKRIMKTKVVVKKTPYQIIFGEDGEPDFYHVNMIVYESVDGVKHLDNHWKRADLTNASLMRIAEDLMALKRSLTSVVPSQDDFAVFEDVQAPMREDRDTPVLQLSTDLSNWDIDCDSECHKTDPAVLRDAKPILALLNRHIPADLNPEAAVAKDGQSITLHLGEDLQSIVFTASEMKFLKESIYLHHKMISPADVFITGTDKDCKVVSVLGWETAEYCPSGYGMGIRDAMLGKQIKDSLWYLVLRREGLTRRKAKTAPSEPAQTKLAEVMHLLDSWAEMSPSLTYLELKEQREYESYMKENRYTWKDGRIGWHTSWFTEVKNISRERWCYLTNQ